MIYSHTSTVIHGNKLGRTIGFPTANIDMKRSDIDFGVYVCNIIYTGKIFKGVGTYMQGKDIFEVHIFDFNEDIYGQEIEVFLLKKIRENRKFENFDALKQQIKRDSKNAQNIKLIVLTFGSFDVTHLGHAYYLGEARKYGTHLITIIASDKNIEKIKGNPPQYPQSQRVKAVEILAIADEVIPGSVENPLGWLEIYAPHTLCLGYDQKGDFVDLIPQKIQELGLQTSLIRLSSFKPELYKSTLLKQKKKQS